jgi:SAM-dependent methyltransferase
MTSSQEKRSVAWNYQQFLKYKNDHPEATYATFSVQPTLAQIELGAPQSTLGPKLNADSDWLKAGAPTFRRYRGFFPLEPTHRVADYGCGTLRLGVQFIRFLHAGGYIGLDVAREYVEIGRGLLGAPLIAEKRPRIDVISSATVAEAAAFDADFVISTACCYHVHPADIGEYFANLVKICHKPGAVLCFDASVADEPLVLSYMSWPTDFYQRALPGFTFHKFHPASTREEEGHQLAIGTLEFRRN